MGNGAPGASQRAAPLSSILSLSCKAASRKNWNTSPDEYVRVARPAGRLVTSTGTSRSVSIVPTGPMVPTARPGLLSRIIAFSSRSTSLAGFTAVPFATTCLDDLTAPTNSSRGIPSSPWAFSCSSSASSSAPGIDDSSPSSPCGPCGPCGPSRKPSPVLLKMNHRLRKLNCFTASLIV